MKCDKSSLWAIGLISRIVHAQSDDRPVNAVQNPLPMTGVAQPGGPHFFNIDKCLTGDQLFIPLNDPNRVKESAAIPATALTPQQQAAFTNITHFASAAYCTSPSVMAWTCGADCRDVSPGFIPRAAVDPGAFDSAPRWYVGWDPRNLDMSGNNRGNGTIIVGHQGTAAGQGFGVSSNILIDQIMPNQTLFPGTASLLLHRGYAQAQQASADAIYAAVMRTMREFNSSSIVVTGHSQGAAVALLEGMSLKLRLQARASVSVISFAMPRTGSPAWADFVDRTDIYVRHVNNVIDPVPCTPPMDFTLGAIPGFFAGFRYRYSNVKGGLHIQTVNGTWYDCPGHDNSDNRCSTGVVADTQIINIINSFDRVGRDFLAYHGGPYNGIRMGAQCTPPVA